MASPYRRSLPDHPDLEQQKKQAKELLQAFHAGDRDAHARVRAVLPDKQAVTLADAQFVLAREYGFNNWVALRQHIEAQREDRPDPRERIHHAFLRGDAGAVRTILQEHPPLRALMNEPLFPFNSPAIVCYANHDAMVEVLLECGADPNRRSEWWAGGFHALHSATGRAAERLIAAGAEIDACAAAHLDRPDILARLISEDPSRVHERGGDGQTPLHFANSRAVIDLLLDAGADINARDVDHRSTPAEWMLKQRRGAGRYDLARYLVERGASVDIFLAAALGLTDRARALLEADRELLELRTGHGDYGEQPPSSYHMYFWTIGQNLTPLDVAAQFEHDDTLTLMLEFATPLQRLLSCCRIGDEVQAHAIVREHPDIIASMPRDAHRTIAEAAWAGNTRAVQLMLELGFDPGVPGHDSGTALHCAAWEGSIDTVEVLLRNACGRALVAARDAHYNATPLGWCCHGSVHGNRSHDHAGVAQLLLDAGAPPETDTSGAAPSVQRVLERAAREHHAGR